jgi:hypothetical protein
MQCFLDLDGVLCDFHRGALFAHGRPASDYSLFRQGDIAACLGIAPTRFWSRLERAEFWAGLEPTPECAAILTAVENQYGPENVCILSSPTLSPGSLAGKYQWIRHHLPAYSRRFLIGPPKHFLARADAVLIDGSDDNVRTFRRAGGWAILVPRPWNAGWMSESPFNVAENLQQHMRRLEMVTAFHDH